MLEKETKLLRPDPEEAVELSGDTEKYPFVVAVSIGPGRFGTGILISPRFVLTCKHVLRRDNSIADIDDTNLVGSAKVLTFGGSTTAVVKRDVAATADLALLELANPLALHAVQFADCLPRIGRPLVAVGIQESPQNAAQLSVADTELKLINRSTVKGETLDFQLAGGVRAGYSGGPVLVRQGRNWYCVGVTRLGSPVGLAAATSIAIGMAHVRPLLAQCNSSGKMDLIPTAGQHDLRYRQSLLWTIATLILLGINLLLRDAPIGKRLDVQLYRLLGAHRVLNAGNQDLPVAVLDVSAMQKSGAEDDRTGITSRTGLKQIISSLFPSDSRLWPRGIALDVDFSPDQNGPIGEQDSEFFQFCQQITSETNVPIILGVHRTERSAQSIMWLGWREYSGMAAALSIPVEPEDRPDAVRKANQWMREWIETGPADKSKIHLPTLSAAMADFYLSRQREYEDPYPSGGHWGVTAIRRQYLDDKTSAGEFLADYSPLESLQSQTIRLPLPPADNQSQQGRSFHGKVLFIGYADGARDKFTVPARSGPVAGIYLHACAAWSLIHGPAFFWTPLGRIVVDLALGVLIFSVLIRAYSRCYLGFIQYVQGHILVPSLLGLLLIGGGILLIYTTRIVSDDSLMAGAMLLVYSSIQAAKAAILRNHIAMSGVL